jgi:Fe-S oxidoreductase
VPTHSAFCVDIPPAAVIEPVVALVASVVSPELRPCANGTRTVVVVCPSFVIAVDRPVAKSAVRALNAVDDMTVPVTTGWPAELMEKTPLPL